MESAANYEAESEDTENEQAEDSDFDTKYKCTFPGCSATFLRPSRLKRHLNLHYNKRPYKCTFEGCDKSYTNSSHLKRHSQTHELIAKTYTCQHCGVSISTLSNLKRHYNRVHNTEQELFCVECEIKFRKKSRYEEHMATHRNTPEIKCEKCGKMFLTQNLLGKHMRIHANKSRKCPVKNCQEVFEKWSLVMEHRKTVHKIEYPCSKCDKIFSTKTRLKIHSKTHSDSRPAIPCPYENCNRMYYFRRNLDQHIRTKHMGKKFHCDICDKKLTTKQKIEEHIIKCHLSEKQPFKRKSPMPRKDIGTAKRSVLTTLTGIQLAANVEVKLMQRRPTALLRDNAVEESSYSEDDRASDVSAKGA